MHNICNWILYCVMFRKLNMRDLPFWIQFILTYRMEMDWGEQHIAMAKMLEKCGKQFCWWRQTIASHWRARGRWVWFKWCRLRISSTDLKRTAEQTCHRKVQYSSPYFWAHGRISYTGSKVRTTSWNTSHRTLNIKNRSKVVLKFDFWSTF